MIEMKDAGVVEIVILTIFVANLLLALLFRFLGERKASDLSGVLGMIPVGMYLAFLIHPFRLEGVFFAIPFAAFFVFTLAMLGVCVRLIADMYKSNGGSMTRLRCYLDCHEFTHYQTCSIDSDMYWRCIKKCAHCHKEEFWGDPVKKAF